MLIHGNNLDELPKLADASIDAIITDPPYELGFMGKSWDSTGIAYNVQLWRECLRVLKPGGHLLAFSGSRTYHRMAVAIEDAGFEIRDQIMWVYGSGFPKSLDVSKAIDKAAGAEREVLGESPNNRNRLRHNYNSVGNVGSHASVTAPATNAAKQWEGWGTALKPAHEPIVLARKPLDGTVANNVLQHGTGALNIDACRVATDDAFGGGAKATSGFVKGYENDGWTPGSSLGRWPANLIHDGSDEVLELFPTETKGSAARFFYCAKASRTERNTGLDGLPEKQTAGGGGGIGDYLEDVNSASGKYGSEKAPAQNFHPTVKPLALIHYLIKLVTPPGGTILDPFLGSGTTAVAATQLGHPWIGCELTPDYWPIIEARVNHAERLT